ncbi:hypothetical protein [Candidatus Formimonas warabiya]|uniref:Uncharacterized protein n=1 Tax=Formimonas warabiya TaxID=1761012 RepID=A0A3G1KNA4_FORW1|nr:hypothetical protein [Candidatus Formimonas warabiya]ATW23906.1 hypothetical protein DCMF_03035 [Candidatus Formimonas warabiya]
MKVTFRITLSDFPPVDEATAKEILSVYLQNGIQVKADDISEILLEKEEIHAHSRDIKGLQPAASTHDGEEPHASFEEQMKHMED